jgi:uncharacterized protein YsxB (DUF464 family)
VFEWKNKFHFEISGHAESGPYGHDLVCAATTGIVSGMLNAIDKRFEKEVSIKIKDNLISIDTKSDDKLLIHDLETLQIQLKTLEIQYPNNIQIKEVR